MRDRFIIIGMRQMGGRISFRTNSFCYWCKGYYFSSYKEMGEFIDLLISKKMVQVPRLELYQDWRVVIEEYDKKGKRKR